MQTKAITHSHEVKDEAKGLVSLQFAKYDVIDAHGDVHRKGAFEDGAEVLVSMFNHGSWQQGMPPVGRGKIRDTADGPTAELQFFMDTTAGRDTFNAVKGAGNLQQWSYGFDTMEESYGEHDGKDVRFLIKQKVYEISPVLVGAGGADTRTLSVKGEKRDYSAEQRRQMADNGEAMADGSFPIKDRADLENAIHLAGHASDPAAAKRHIRKRARALGLEDLIPDSWDSGKMKMFDHCLEVLTSFKRLVDRAEEIVALRQADGKKGLGDDTESMLVLIDTQTKRLDALLRRPAPESSTDTKDDLTSLYLEFCRDEISMGEQ